MRDDRTLFLRLSRTPGGKLTHTGQSLGDASCLIQLDDDTVICSHNRLNIQRRGKKGLQSGKAAILAERLQRVDHKIGLLLISHFQDTLRNFTESEPLLVHIADGQSLV